jgi:hypothetical protein
VRIEIRNLKCPDCGLAPCELVEHWSSNTVRFGAEKGFRDSSGYLVEGGAHHVEATCSCGKTWKLKGVRQVTDLDRQ